MRRTKIDPLDVLIEQAWYRLAFGVQVNIMDIPAIFRSVRTAVESGVALDTAVQAAISAYRVRR
jgi:hypothetical protein